MGELTSDKPFDSYVLCDKTANAGEPELVEHAQLVQREYIYIHIYIYIYIHIYR